MKIPGVYIPEFARLPPEDRKKIIRRCEDSNEMHRLHARIRLMTWISVPSAVAVTVLSGMFLFHWTHDLVVALASFLGMACFAASRLLLLMRKVQLIRQEATKNPGGSRED